MSLDALLSHLTLTPWFPGDATPSKGVVIVSSDTLAPLMGLAKDVMNEPRAAGIVVLGREVADATFLRHWRALCDFGAGMRAERECLCATEDGPRVVRVYLKPQTA